MDHEAAIQKHVDHRPMRHLNRDRDDAGLARDRLDPVSQLRKSGAAVREFTFSRDPTAGIENAGLMFLRTPIDSGEPTDRLLGHLSLPSCSTRAATTPADPCTGARRRNFLLGIRRGQPAEAQVQSWCSWHRCMNGCSRLVGPRGQLTQILAERFPWYRCMKRAAAASAQSVEYQRIRAEAGMPKFVIRLSTLQPIFASVRCRGRLRA